MKTFKRIFLALVLVLSLVLVVACGGGGTVELSGISISKQPTKVVYVEGEKFDAAGMVVTATYSDSSSKAITDYTFSPAGTLAVSDTKVTVSYKGKTAEVAITVNEALYTIEEVFGLKNNAQLKVEAVVFEVVEGGFYVADSANGHIFVNDSTAVEVGDKVKIAGQYGYITSYPTIKNATVSVLAKGVALPIDFVDADLADLAKANPEEPRNYARLVSVEKVNVAKDASGKFYLADIDDNKLYFDETTDVTALEEFADKRVDAKVLLTRYMSGLCYIHLGESSSVVLNEETLEDVREIAQADIDSKMVDVIYGKINLPQSHPTVSGLTYTWTSSDETSISIVDNKAVVALLEEQREVVLTATFTKGELSGTIEYTVISMPIVERSLAELLADLPVVDNSIVKTYGVVVGKFRNQGGGTRGVFLQDQTTKETVLLQFSLGDGLIAYNSDEFMALADGDLIHVTCAYSFAGSDYAPRLADVSSMTVTEHNAEYAHQFESAYELATLEDYAEFNKHIADYAGKLVKIVNPFLCYSKANPSPTNWMTFSPDFVKYNDYNNGEAGCPTYTYAFLLVAQDEELGSTAWRNELPVPSDHIEVTQLEITIYAYVAVYGPTYAQFIICEPEFIQYTDAYNTQVRLQTKLPTAVEGGAQIELPDTFEGHAITWSCEDGMINPANGKVAAVSESGISTLKATIEGLGEFEFRVAVTALVPVEIAELRTMETGSAVYVRGVVAGLHTANQSNSAIELLIKDEDSNAIIGVTGLGEYFGSHMKQLDTASEDVLKGHQTLTFGPLALGDVVMLPVVVNAPANSYQDAGKVTVAWNGSDLAGCVVEHGHSIALDKTDANIITITSQEELCNFMLTSETVEDVTTYGLRPTAYQIVKLSGTIKAVCYNGSSTKIKQTPYLRFFFEATALAEQRFADKKQSSPCFMTAFCNMSFGEGSVGESVFTGAWTTSYDAPLSFDGDLYCVYVGGNSSSNYGCFIILGENAVVPAVAE